MNQKEKFIYLAGIIDGEGYLKSITNLKLNKRRKSKDSYAEIRITVTNTSIELIQWLKHNFGGRYCASVNRHPEKWKTVYTWTISKYKVASILPKIYPFLIVRKERAKELINYLVDDSRKPGRWKKWKNIINEA